MINQNKKSESFLLCDPELSTLLHGCLGTVNSELGNTGGYPYSMGVREEADRYLFIFNHLLPDRLGLSQRLDKDAVFGESTRRMEKYFNVNYMGLDLKVGSQVRFTMDFEVPKERVRRLRIAHLLKHL